MELWGRVKEGTQFSPLPAQQRCCNRSSQLDRSQHRADPGEPQWRLVNAKSAGGIRLPAQASCNGMALAPIAPKTFSKPPKEGQ